jgi:phage-related baseplate assembly protein
MMFFGGENGACFFVERRVQVSMFDLAKLSGGCAEVSVRVLSDKATGQRGEDGSGL